MSRLSGENRRERICFFYVIEVLEKLDLVSLELSWMNMNLEAECEVVEVLWLGISEFSKGARCRRSC